MYACVPQYRGRWVLSIFNVLKSSFDYCVSFGIYAYTYNLPPIACILLFHRVFFLNLRISQEKMYIILCIIRNIFLYIILYYSIYWWKKFIRRRNDRNNVWCFIHKFIFYNNNDNNMWLSQFFLKTKLTSLIYYIIHVGTARYNILILSWSDATAQCSLCNR